MSHVWVDEHGVIVAEGGDNPPEHSPGAVALYPDELEGWPDRVDTDEDGMPIGGLEALEHYHERYLQLTEIKETLEAAYKERLDRVATRMARLEGTVGHFCRDIVRSQVGDRDKKRFIDLPTGRIGLRRGRDTVDVVDEDSAIEWAWQYCPGAVKTRVTLRKSDLPLEKIEQIPGVRIKEGEDKIYIQGPKKKKESD